MKKLQIVRVDKDSVEKAYLQIGNNIIGRSGATGREGDEVVKHAVTINLLNNNEMTITPVSPCYMKSGGSSRWRLLKLGASVPIKPGDICSLLSDRCWFKIVAADGMETDHEQYTSKRKANQDVDSNIPDKVSRIESRETVKFPSALLNQMSTDTEGTTVNNKNLINNEHVTNTAVSEIQEICNTSSSMDQAKTHATSSKPTGDSLSREQSLIVKQNAHKPEDTNINRPTGTVFLSDQAPGYSSVTLKDTYVTRETDSSNIRQDHSQPPIATQVEKPSAYTSTNIPRREKCIYGRNCYRKNPQHKAKFSHPDDADYYILDNREECPYGIKCYRRNPQHKMRFKHTANSRCRQNVQVSDNFLDEFAEESAEESVDESDYEPSSNVESSDDELYSEKDESDCEDGTTG